jgi:hypothetical protein
MNKPTTVKIGLGALIASASISFLGLLIMVSAFAGHPTAQLKAMIVTMTASTMIAGTLIVFMFMRHNWPRVVYAIVLIIGLTLNTAKGNLPNIPMTLDIIGVCCLFLKDSTMWFKTKNE